MRKQKLQPGMVVELKDGTKCLFTHDDRFYVLEDGTWHCEIKDFLDDLTTDEEEFDIVKIFEDYTLKKVIWERNHINDKLRQIRCLLDEIIEEQN